MELRACCAGWPCASRVGGQLAATARPLRGVPARALDRRRAPVPPVPPLSCCVWEAQRSALSQQDGGRDAALAAHGDQHPGVRREWHATQEIVCKTVEGPVVVSTYADLARRSQLCALALQRLGLKHGDVVATLAWNTTRHLECWYGVMGIGCVCQTLNPRLSPADIAYIADHGQAQLLLVDAPFLPIVAQIRDQLPHLRGVVVLTDRQHMPQQQQQPQLPGLLCYEELLDSCVDQLPGFAWPQLDETTPCGLCYTSGTTGRPKGVRYTHRSNYLHAFIVTQPDALCLGSANNVLMIVPMFHANSWGLAFAAPMVGCRLVLPGPGLDGASLLHLIDAYKVDVSAMVPTVLLGLLQHMAAHRVRRLPSVRRIVLGGAAAPASMIEALEDMGIEVRHMWGMTELSPLGSLGLPSGPQLGDGLSREELVALKTAQGRPHLLCDFRIVDDSGRPLPCDGEAVGELQVRGAVVVEQYHRHPEPTVDAQRWFSTGDVASIDPLGTMRIRDRSKDVVKSGGEWISSISLENAAMGHPKVLEAAVIAMPDERWGERPLLIIVPQPGAGGQPEQLRDEVLAFMSDHPQVAKFAVPDDVCCVEEIPHTATGKVSKVALRRMFKDHRPPRRDGGSAGGSASGGGPRSKL